MKVYKLECLTEDGDIECNGYYFNKENAETAAEKINEYPMNKKYNIIQQIVEIETNDELLAALESETEVIELEPDEMYKEGIKYLQEKYPDKEILKLPDLDELGEFTDFVMGMQIGHALAQSQTEVMDEDILKTIPYKEPISKHQSDINIGWIRCMQAMRDNKIK